MDKNSVLTDLQNHLNAFNPTFNSLFENIDLFSDCFNNYLRNEETYPIVEKFKNRVMDEMEKQKESGKTIDSIFQSSQTLKEDITKDLEILNVILEDLREEEDIDD